jgi:Asp-tRNA(Asn)/Glu-tRNA(Gln) amidotransferase C subunit
MWNQHLDLQTKQLDLQTQYDEIMAEIDQIDDLNAQANELSTAIASGRLNTFRRSSRSNSPDHE